MAIESVALDIGLLTGPLLVAGIALMAPRRWRCRRLRC